MNEMKKVLIISAVLIIGMSACDNSNHGRNHLSDIETLELTIDSLKNMINQNTPSEKNQIVSFLTFQDDNAENAMNLYMDLFDNSKVINIQRWGKEGPGTKGKIMHATFELNGRSFMCSDSPPVHDWDFTPAISNYVDCESDKELNRLFSRFAEKGKVMMPLNNYGFSQKFGWVVDEYGISWQLNLP